MSDWHHLLDFIHEHRGEPLALATLVAVEGSSYRRPGARLLIDASERHAGSLSGGCLEDGISKVAQDVISDGQIRTEIINTEPHFGCPGILTIQIEKVEPNGLLDELALRVLERESFTITTFKNGSSLTEEQARECFREVVSPRPRIIVIGWTADQEPLFQIAQTLNWESHRVIKDEGIRNELKRIADESLSVCSAETFQETFVPDSSTAILIMSHHMATDLAILKHTVQAGYAYVGLLGSKRRREKLLNELGESGFLENADWVSSFHAPVGLDIGAKHPTTIALSIMSEIQAVFAGAEAGFLTEKKGRIHEQGRVCKLI